MRYIIKGKVFDSKGEPDIGTMLDMEELLGKGAEDWTATHQLIVNLLWAQMSTVGLKPDGSGYLPVPFPLEVLKRVTSDEIEIQQDEPTQVQEMIPDPTADETQTGVNA